MSKLVFCIYGTQNRFNQIIGSTGHIVSLQVTQDKTILHIFHCLPINIYFERKTYLPVIQYFKSILKASAGLDLVGCESEKHKKIIHLLRILLQWHFKIGQINFQIIQWIGRIGMLGNLGKNMGITTTKAQ